MDVNVIFSIVILVLCFIVIFMFLSLKKITRLSSVCDVALTDAQKTLSVYKQRYDPIINLDDELKRVQQEKIDTEQCILSLRQDYKAKKQVFDALVVESAIYDEKVELAEFGHYEPHFEFDTAEEYKQTLEHVREEQKSLLKTDQAAWAPLDMTFNGNAAEGKRMMERSKKLALRAFNNECDAAIANVRWNNVERMELRISKSAEAIAKFNKTTGLHILPEYIELKIDELRLAHELEEKKQKEKEEQAEIRRQMREEAKFEKDLESAIKEEEKYQTMLDKATRDAENATGGRLQALQEKIALLSTELAEAHAKSERAQSMAQQTRAGYVYIISNIGSFGTDVYKIGMTRRLDPLDRVKELGDASVPFIFDVHALIYSEDAPTLENALHKEFDKHRLNLVNAKKEFFRANLDDIEAVVKSKIPNASFIKTAEARDHNESLAIVAQNEAVQLASDVRLDHPQEI